MVEHVTDNDGVEGPIPSTRTRKMRYFIGSLGIIIGVSLVWKTFAIAQMFGSIDWAEEHLGSGSSYTLYKVIGIAFIILSALFLFDALGFFLSPLRNLFGGFIRKR